MGSEQPEDSQTKIPSTGRDIQLLFLSMYRKIGFKVHVLNIVCSMVNYHSCMFKIAFLYQIRLKKMQTTANLLAIVSKRPYCTKVLKYIDKVHYRLNSTTKWQTKLLYFAHAASGDAVGDGSED